MFPGLSPEQITLLFELYNNDIHQVVQSLLEDLPLSSILGRLKSLRLVCPTRVVQVRPQHVVRDGLRFYKGDTCISSELEIELVGRPAVDLGGVRRQFFTTFLREMPIALDLVEFNGHIGFPSLHTEALVGGHYARLGRVIVHSVLQEGPGFPYFPKSIFYYLVGGIDLAVTYLSVDELPLAVESLVKEVSLHILMCTIHGKKHASIGIIKLYTNVLPPNLPFKAR